MRDELLRNIKRSAPEEGSSTQRGGDVPERSFTSVHMLHHQHKEEEMSQRGASRPSTCWIINTKRRRCLREELHVRCQEARAA
ncbi:hypothetical protein PBY51_021908 [Eleginops maclovinus]|uniref:Uncharacterized protein n=1 Tax=Eleginops maclovinus TaxID=56733 RepID=A0AAN7X9Y5_ELEMC|nr:hypothetical protein PBY51_021908 [Eleginops maclovinus]